jgi:molybdopterin molybdotransferase
LTDHALGRILARSCRQRFYVTPPFDNAAMDGFAVATSAALTGRGTVDTCRCRRGHSGRADLGRAACQACRPRRIFTGAPKVPVGADAVVMQEDVQRTGSNHPHRPAPAARPEHPPRGQRDGCRAPLVLDQGRDALTAPAKSRPVPQPGQASGARARRRLRVALLVTGDEIRASRCADRCGGADLGREHANAVARP